jgi:hypothetical protein
MRPPVQPGIRQKSAIRSGGALLGLDKAQPFGGIEIFPAAGWAKASGSRDTLAHGIHR